MTSVYRTHIGISSLEDRLTVDIIDVTVTVIACKAVGFKNDVTAQNTVIIIAIEVGTREHDVGNVGVLLADLLIHLAVRILQVFGVGSIVIVVGYKRRHGQGCHILDNIVLAASVSGETEVDMVDIHSAADNALIGVSGTSGASALGDRATVVNDGGDVTVFHALTKHGILLQSDLQASNVAVGGEVNGKVTKLAVGKTVERFISGFDTKIRTEGSMEAADRAMQ